jgi:hypothetical protein
MERVDLGRANALNRQAAELQQAINIASREAKIVYFVIEDASGDMATGERIEVSAEGIQTPPQMMGAIHEQLRERYNAIIRQLEEMGVAGAEPQKAKR